MDTKGVNMKINQIVIGSSMIAMGVILPFLTLNNPSFGQVLLLMHIPVLIAGFVLPPGLALMVGLITPVLRSLLVGMPVLFPVAITMAFELAFYAFFVSILTKKIRLNHVLMKIYIVLILSMLLGRVVLGLSSYLFYSWAGWLFSIDTFIKTAYVLALPGILLQLILIPTVVLSLNRLSPEILKT